MTENTTTIEIAAYNQGGTIVFHKAGCRDLSQRKHRFFSRNADIFANLEEAIERFLDTGDENNPGCTLFDMKFLPCCGAGDDQIFEIVNKIAPGEYIG